MCGQVVCEQVVSGQVVCVCEQVVYEAAGGGGRRRTGYRTKNKNPTQRCGELTDVMNLHIFIFIFIDV